MVQYRDKSELPKASELSHDAYLEGCSLYKREEFSGAKHSFESALEYWPEDPQAWFALGNCHDAMNKPAKAEACYRMSLTYAGPDALPDVYYNLGNSLFDQGNYQHAIDYFSQVSSQSKAHRAAQKNMALAKKRLA